MNREVKIDESGRPFSQWTFQSTTEVEEASKWLLYPLPPDHVYVVEPITDGVNFTGFRVYTAHNASLVKLDLAGTRQAVYTDDLSITDPAAKGPVIGDRVTCDGFTGILVGIDVHDEHHADAWILPLDLPRKPHPKHLEGARKFVNAPLWGGNVAPATDPARLAELTKLSDAELQDIAPKLGIMTAAAMLKKKQRAQLVSEIAKREADNRILP